MVSFHRNPTGNRPALVAAALAAALASLAPASAMAQETVIIGGSGLPPVEVHLDVIDAYGVSMAPRRRLLIPGEPRPPLAGTLVLRPPGGRSAPPTPAPKLKPPPVAAAPTLKPPALKPPALKPPTPAPAPRTAPAPAPPAPVVAAVTPPAPPPPAPPPAPSVAAAPAAPPPSAVPAPATTQAPKPREQAAVAPAIPIPPSASASAPAPAAAPAPVPAPARVEPPAPPPAPAAAPQQEMAALPPVQFINVDDQQALRVLFSGASTRLSPRGEQQLKALAGQLGESNSRVQLKAYGGGSSETVSAARRLSLSRALAVRSYLIELGIRSTRIDVRALGIAKDGGPAERVDLVLLAR